ncbi:HupE/UreJ family protein, partial [Polaribacter sp.]|nr:HupE/UreJ family protein [Polaribacter sp.]
IHGLGFSTYFKMMVSKGEDKIMPLLEFALGIEVSQIIIVFGILVLGTLLDFFTRVSKRDWILVASSIVIGISLQMMLERMYW